MRGARGVPGAAAAVRVVLDVQDAVVVRVVPQDVEVAVVAVEAVVVVADADRINS